MTEPVEPIIRDPENRKRNRLLILFTILLIIVGGVLLLVYLLYWQFHEKTDDAYGNGNLIQVNSSIEGSVVAFYADDTDLVEEGQLLVQLDNTYYKQAYERALASLEMEVILLKQLQDSVQVNKADVEMRKVNLSKSKYDFRNRSQLIESKAISNEDYIHSQDQLNIAESELKRAEANLKSAENALGTTSIERHPRIEEKKNAVKEAYYNLKHTSIYAPAKGYIAQRSVNVGQTVSRMKNLMSIIPVDYVWVDANYKETQLKYMRIGQPATVRFDIYGSEVKYDGRVQGIGSGSGSVFSLIPPQNATGNWIKIVQRVPVRISLDEETVKKYPIRLGLSAEVDVDISNQDLPMVAEVPNKKIIAATNVFDIDMKKVDKIIDEIIQKQELK